MIIATFNANGIRARLPILLDWIEKHHPDVLCIQETKVQDPDFPETAFKNIGYHCVCKGQKSYNGVAILSKVVPEIVDIPSGIIGSRTVQKEDWGGVSITSGQLGPWRKNQKPHGSMSAPECCPGLPTTPFLWPNFRSRRRAPRQAEKSFMIRKMTIF